MGRTPNRQTTTPPSHIGQRWGIGLLLLGICGCGKSDLTPRPREAPRVTVAHPEVRTLVDEEQYNGWLEAAKVVEVRSRVRGHILKVHFQDGDLVREGQPLFDIDGSLFAADLKQVEAQGKALEAQKLAAVKDVERNRKLVKSAALSQQELDKSEADELSFEAQILAKQAEADRHRLNIQYSKILAPLSGKIGKALLIEGDLVNAGGTDPLLATIVVADPILVAFSMDERAVQRYQQRQASENTELKKPIRERRIPFAFQLDTEQGFPRHGVIAYSENTLNSATGTILIRGESDNPGRELIPGSRVQVRLPTSEPYAAVVVPDAAVLSDQDRKYLLVLGKNNLVLREDVSLGRLLDDGQRVILPPRAGKTTYSMDDWIKAWEDRWMITLGLQRARIDYPVQPLDKGGEFVNTKQ